MSYGVSINDSCSVTIKKIELRSKYRLFFEKTFVSKVESTDFSLFYLRYIANNNGLDEHFWTKVCRYLPP